MKSCLVITMAALFSTAASAQSQGEPTTASVFATLDTDKSGGISETEAQAAPVVADSFAQADANADGNITRDEFSAAFTMKQPASATSPQSSTEPSQ